MHATHVVELSIFVLLLILSDVSLILYFAVTKILYTSGIVFTVLLATLPVYSQYPPNSIHDPLR